MDPLTTKAELLAIAHQRHLYNGLCDNYICILASNPLRDHPENLINIFTGCFGGEWTWESLLDVGRQTIAMELEWNEGAGITVEDYKLPDWCAEPCSFNGAKFDYTVDELQTVMQTVYPLRSKNDPPKPFRYAKKAEE